MEIRIAILLILVFSSINSGAVSLNGYNYEKDIAVFHIKEKYFDKNMSSKNSSLFSVDFKNKTVKKIDQRRYLSDVSVNFNLNLVLYSDDDEYVLYDMAESVVLKNINQRASRLFLDDQVFSISGRDISKKELLVYRPNENVELMYPLDDKVFWGSDWNDECKCVEFEISNSWSDPHYVARERDGELKRVTSGESFIGGGPNDISAYFFHEGSDDEYIQFKISNEATKASYYSSGSSEKKYFLWGDRTLRILGMSALIDLETLRLINKTPYMWSDNIPVDDKNVDLASDINGYVLKWNKGSLLFEVEDINTGKTIKTYKKFW